MNEPAICQKLRDLWQDAVTVRDKMQLVVEAIEEALASEGCGPPNPEEIEVT